MTVDELVEIAHCLWANDAIYISFNSESRQEALEALDHSKAESARIKFHARASLAKFPGLHHPVAVAVNPAGARKLPVECHVVCLCPESGALVWHPAKVKADVGALVDERFEHGFWRWRVGVARCPILARYRNAASVPNACVRCLQVERHQEVRHAVFCHVNVVCGRGKPVLADVVWSQIVFDQPVHRERATVSCMNNDPFATRKRNLFRLFPTMSRHIVPVVNEILHCHPLVSRCFLLLQWLSSRA